MGSLAERSERPPWLEMGSLMVKPLTWSKLRSKQERVQVKHDKNPPAGGAAGATAGDPEGCACKCCTSEEGDTESFWDGIVNDTDLKNCGKHAFCDLACEPPSLYIVRLRCHAHGHASTSCLLGPQSRFATAGRDATPLPR
jgi:hypothetical protein